MNKPELPDYSGIFLEPDEIEYGQIDPPLRSLIHLINCQTWIRTFGCCAGHAHHGEDPGDEHQFFIGLFAKGDYIGIDRLQLWVDEANRINGPTGLRVEVVSVHNHPFGQGSVDGWYAYRIAAHEIPGRKITNRSQTYLRLIKCLETAWKRLWPDVLPDT